MKKKIENSNDFLSEFQNKTPVYLADLCKSGEILYPGDKFDDYVCDCKPGNFDTDRPPVSINLGREGERDIYFIILKSI